MTTPAKIENPFKYNEDPELNMMFDKMLSLKQRVANEFAKAEKIAGFGEAANFIPCINGTIDLPNYQTLYDHGNAWRRPDLSVIDKTVKDAIVIAKGVVAGLKEQNVPINAHNQKVVDQVKQIMTRLGIPLTYTTQEYASSRSRTKKTISHSAGYLGDLTRNTPQSNVSTLEYRITTYERDYEAWVKRIQEAEKKARIEQDTHTVNTKILGNPKLVATLMQAGVNILAEVQKAVEGEKAGVIEFCMAQAIENVIARDKYLKLAYGLRLSSEAWIRPESLQHAYAAIGGFNTDSSDPEDAEIAQCINHAITNWDSKKGGRVFQDTEWSILKIMDKVKDRSAMALLGELDLLADEI